MLFGVSLQDAIEAIGVLGILGIVFAESGLMVGFFLPGDTLLFTAGFLTQQHVLNIHVFVLILLITLAAVLGDNIGYLIGHKFGRRLFSRPRSLVFNNRNLATAERFYDKYGAVTVMIARFLPILRAFGAVVAGISNMRYAAFLLFDILGSFGWALSMTLLGYYGGAVLQANGVDVETYIVPIVLLATLVTFGTPLYHLLREPENRRAVLRRLGIKRGSGGPKAD